MWTSLNSLTYWIFPTIRLYRHLLFPLFTNFSKFIFNYYLTDSQSQKKGTFIFWKSSLLQLELLKGQFLNQRHMRILETPLSSFWTEAPTLICCGASSGRSSTLCTSALLPKEGLAVINQQFSAALGACRMCTLSGQPHSWVSGRGRPRGCWYAL